MKINNPFVKCIPSVFVVCSPFQALCAIAAIRQLEIKDYKMVTLLRKGNVRNSQLIQLLNKEQIHYKSFTYTSRIYLQFIKLFALKSKKQGYNRLFVGDFRDFAEHYIGFLYIQDDADVVYLDDGSSTIDILKGTYEDSNSALNKRMIKKISCRRNLEIHKNWMTIYSDISNPQYNIEELKFENVMNKSVSASRSSGIYIVGTYVDAYCKNLEIPEDVFVDKLGHLMETLHSQYPDEEIAFIPHGREYKDYGQRLCKKYNCIFIRPEIMIEQELMRHPNPPKIIYGYASTALYNLKKMFPDTRVVNIFFVPPKETPFYKKYISISEYFQQNGIEWVRELIS